MPISATNIARMVVNRTKSSNKSQKYPHSQNLRSLGPKLAILAFLAIIWPKMPISATNIARTTCNGAKSGNKIQKYPHSQNLRSLQSKMAILAHSANFDLLCQI